MSISSQVWQTEGIKDAQRKPWITANAMGRRNRQESTVFSMGNDHKIGHIPKSHAVNLESSPLSTYTYSMESPLNRRHGLIFPKHTSGSHETCTRTRTWGSDDKVYHHNHDLSNNNSRCRDTIAPVNFQKQNIDSNDISRRSNFSVPLSSSSNSTHSRLSFKKLSQQYPLSKDNPSEISPFDLKPIPEALNDQKNIALLEKTLGGRMRGEVELRINDGIPFHGFCRIDEAKGSLVFEGPEKECNFSTIVSDLRGSEVKAIQPADGSQRYIQLYPPSLEIKIDLIPVISAEFDMWYAVFLSWKKTVSTKITPTQLTKSSSCDPENNRHLRQLGSNIKNTNEARNGNIIKVAKLLLWGPENLKSLTPTSQRSSNRELRISSPYQWYRVSSILQDDGMFKLLTENDNTPLSIIHLSQLSRCSIQPMDKSVVGEPFCIAIYPLYAASTSQLSFFHPVYIASESRLMYEVWFCLLRAFTVPEIYGQQAFSFCNENDKSSSSVNISMDDVFRVEKSIKIRIVQAKLSNNLQNKAKIAQTSKSSRDDVEIPHGDYFVEVVLNGEVRTRTNKRNDPKNLVWREESEFHSLPPQPSSLAVALKRNTTVVDHGIISPTSRTGSGGITDFNSWKVEVPLHDLDRGIDKETWWPILDHQNERVGELLMSINYDEVVVLLANVYQPISKLLHNFSNGLTKQISQFIPSKLKLVSEIMMNIFQASGHAGDWLTTLVEDEIDGLEKEIPMDCGVKWFKQLDSDDIKFFTMSDREQNLRDMGKSLQEEANLLFRGNSLLTQALDSHMRRVGKEYLEEVLSEKITEINLMNHDCEVDPSRIQNNQDTQKNWNLLFSLTTDIWISISCSAERCPPELRQIFKYIRAVAEDRYGNFLRIVPYTSVSGVLFLRFFCPALINPKTFGLLSDNPPAKAQRTLTLIAKGLQALANLSNFSKKESWMEPMNRFLATHRKGMKNFIDTVCSISTEQNASVTPASYSTPITILGRLPPTSKEGFPSLPYLIDSAREFSRLVKIWIEVASKNPETENLHGELLEFHQLCQQLQLRADACLSKIEQLDKKVNMPQEKTYDLKSVQSQHSAGQQFNLHKLPCVEISGSSRKYPIAPSKSIEVETPYRKFSLGSTSRDLNGTDIDNRQTGINFGLYREEWPLRGFIGGEGNRKEKETRSLI